MMKLLVLFLVAGMLQVSAKGYSQQVSVSGKSLSLEKIFKTIERQTDYVFFYDQDALKNAGPVTLNLKNVSLNRALTACFEEQPLKYNIVGKTIVVAEKPVARQQQNTMNRKVAVPRMQQEDIEVSGLVTDSAGGKLIGVSVTLKSNPSIGTTTDLNGRYILKVPANDALVFGMVGYQTQEVPINGQSKIDIKLQSDVQKLEDIVVTAFGQRQRKADLVSSVTSISPKELRTPVSNLTSALQGRVAGVVSFQRSGEPGADNADFFIRGVGTFGANQKPLILLDNMEVDADALARIPVDDIENFSILRDATASAVYGSRGANGVILVTTKQGKEGPATIALRAEQRVSTPTQTLKFADPVTWMKMRNEASITRDPLDEEPYSQLKIDKTAEGSDPMAYPAVDWLNELTKKTTTTQNYNLGVSGGGKLATYNVSFNYTNDDGLLKMNKLNNFNNNVNFKVINIRSNVGINLTNTTSAMIRTVANFRNYSGPPTSGSEAYNLALRANPVLFLPVYEPGPTQSYIKHPMFGNFGQDARYSNPYAEIMRGYSERRTSDVQVQLELRQDLSSFVTKGLSYRGLANLSRNSYFAQSRVYNPFYYQPMGFDAATNSYTYQQLNPNSGTEYLGFTPGERKQAAIFYMENQLTYQRLFNNVHNVSAMVINTIRDNISTPVDNTISLINTLPSRNVSLSGSIDYGYQNRYLVKFAFGYNGSERFSEKFRWGFFPSIGVAWNISNENFFEPLKPTVSNLKLRFTRGVLGNDQILDTRFFYLSDVNLSSGTYGYTFGLPADASRYALNGVVVNRYANPDIRWEISKQTNYGVDLSLFRSSLTITADYYEQFRDNIVQQRSLSNINGLTAGVYANVGQYKSRGFDGELVYNKNVNADLWFQGRGTFTYATGEYAFYEEPEYANEYRSRLGKSSSQVFGYVAERLFIDDREVYNSPAQEFGSVVRGGDIKYLDINRDGVVNDDDLIPIGFPTNPEINYGFGFSTGYKGVDFSFFFSGVGRTSLFINPTANNTSTSKGVAPFGNDLAPNAVLQAWADDYWSESSKNIYAKWPRLSVAPMANNTAQSTYWMRDGSLMRLKQVELGYTLNRGFLQRYKFKTFRIYLSATNLFKISSFKLWDPEMGGNALNYPLQRVFNIGINATL
ncbi:MAG: TonB-dependent receptor [Niabella sp.]